jgi:hypothetical protein
MLERLWLEAPSRVDHEARALLEREAADARAERRERERAAAQLVCELEAGMRGAAHEPGVRPQVLAHHGSVDDPARREAPRACRDRGAQLDRAALQRLKLDLVAAGPLDGSRDARPHPEAVVRRVRDGVDLQRCDVAVANLELEHD